MSGLTRNRVRNEDAVKHLLTCKQRGQPATIESLAGAVGLSNRRTLGLVQRMEAAELLQTANQQLQLTPAGEELAIHLTRAHRLWETYLTDEAGMNIVRVHREADRAEHRLTPHQVDALDEQLGYPHTDPHGDLIPRAATSTPEVAIPLTDFPENVPARIVHIEDEPPAAFSQIVAVGLKPGRIIRIIERSTVRLVLTDNQDQFSLAPIVAACIQVVPTISRAMRDKDASVSLDRLPLNASGEVLRLDPALRGISRRRLLDLGVTPGTTIQPTLANLFGKTRAYRVRGTLIALRHEQAREVWVKPCTDDPIANTQKGS